MFNYEIWSIVVLALAIIPWVSYVVTLLIFATSILYGRLKLHHKADARQTMDHLPGVSVIKPLMGVDPYLEENLESHFTLSYPKFELLLCVESENDAAVDVVRRIQDRHPTVNCRLFVGGKVGVVNPMVFNMAPAYDSASYDIVWISTSRIKASTDILLDMVAKLQNPNVALVHQIPFTTDQKGFAHTVEKIYFGSNAAKFHMAFHVLGISCFTGMSYLVKKSELDQLNGLGWFGRFLAEDFFIAKMLHEKGFRHSVAAVPAQQNVATASVASYKDRMVRWFRLRLNMMPLTAGLLEPLGESVPLGIYASWSVFYLTGFNPYLWFAIHWTVWMTLDYIQLRGVQNGPLPFRFPLFVVAWMTRELLFVFVYFAAVVDVGRITWGKRTYRLSNCGRTLDVDNSRSAVLIV
jgi:ceramide glucosyltransferase